MYDDSKTTYAIIAILIVVLGGIAYYLRSNSVDEVGKAKISVITETKTVDTKKFNTNTSTSTSTSTSTATSTTSTTANTTSTSSTNNTTKATTTMNENITAPKLVTGAILHTNMGDIEVVFTKDTAKDTVINFASLVANKFYEGIRFHRVIKGFMIQAGDPLSKDPTKRDAWGTGGPGYTIKDELSGKETYPQGTLAMARTPAPNSGGSQFFIVTASPAPLPPDYTVFGHVVKGMDIALKIENVKTGANDVPVEDVIINSVELK